MGFRVETLSPDGAGGGASAKTTMVLHWNDRVVATIVLEADCPKFIREGIPRATMMLAMWRGTGA